MPDYILNGQGHGGVAAKLLANNFDPACMRPWVSDDERESFVVGNVNGKREVMVNNAPALLRKDEWKAMDDTVLRVAQQQLRLVGDLRSRGLAVTLPNGMGSTVFEYEKVSDITPASVNMDGIKESDADRPLFELAGLPLPIIHKDFFFTARQIATSRSKGMPLDTLSVALATRKVVEEAEKMLVGSTAFNYGGYNVYGYTTFPQRLTQSITAPTSANHATTVAEVLSMRKKSIDAGYNGPWVLYAAPAWDAFLDEDYSTAYPGVTLRSRLQAIEGITAVQTGYFLSGNTLLLVQMTEDCVREVIGMDLTTLQWEEQGGMLVKFKVMAIMVPQLRADYEAQTGIVHGS